MKLLLVTPPLTQLNTPYPATAYLTGYLRGRGHDVVQADASLGLVLRLFTPEVLREAADLLRARPASRKRPPPASVAHFLAHAEALAVQAPVAVALLQGRDSSMAHRIAARRYFVEGPRFAKIGPDGHQDEYLDWAFGTMGTLDRARYYASLLLEEVGDALRDGLDPDFAFGRYGEQLAMSQPTLDPLLRELGDDEKLTARVLDGLTRELYEQHRPDVVGFSLPFPGNVLGALRMGKTLRRIAPAVRLVWGGGFVSTELRELCDPRLFDHVDAVVYDDGERPLHCLLEHYAGSRPVEALKRTRVRDDRGQVVLHDGCEEPDVPFVEAGCPTYDGLPLRRYLSILEVLNPMHRLWNDTRWNKLTVAHGCYWKKCTFCDINLPYIADYAPLAAATLVDRMEKLAQETGTRGFHFVDEAASPAGLDAMAREVLRRGLQVSWWGNIRFEKAFTPERVARLRASGCVAVTGGLEVASNRLLTLMEKGVTVEQVARVSKAFTEAGVLVHAYLMYGFPTQTLQETIDSLERVRQLFVQGCLDSAYWHRFSATAHSPIGRNPDKYGIRLLPQPQVSFARNDLPFEDPTGCDHQALGPGLAKAVYNYMHGMGLEEDVRVWFDAEVPRARVAPTFIRRALAEAEAAEPAPKAKLPVLRK